MKKRKKIRTSAKEKHHKKPPILHCTKCGELVCPHCSLNHCEDHNCELIEKTSPEDKAQLLTDKQSLNDLLEELAKAGEKIHATILEVENLKLASINNLRTKFKELHNILEHREQELVEDATTTAQQKLQKLSYQEKTLSLASAELQSVVDNTERYKKMSSIFKSVNTELRKTI